MLMKQERVVVVSMKKNNLYFNLDVNWFVGETLLVGHYQDQIILFSLTYSHIQIYIYCQQKC